MGWECSLDYRAPPVPVSSRSTTETPRFMCLRLQYYTAERSSTAGTKRTALARSLGSTGANPAQPLLCKSPADWTSTCCSWHVSIPLLGTLQMGRRSHLPGMHPTISTHHRDSCYCHNTPLLSGEAEEQGDPSCTQPAAVNRIFPPQPWWQKLWSSQEFQCLWSPNPTEHQGSSNSWPEPKAVHQAAVWLWQDQGLTAQEQLGVVELIRTSNNQPQTVLSFPVSLQACQALVDP